MADPGAQQWLGRADLAWNILLVARLRSVPTREALLERLATMSSAVRLGGARSRRGGRG